MSLRDVDRVLTVMSWFYKQHSENDGILFEAMNQKLSRGIAKSNQNQDKEETEETDDVSKVLKYGHSRSKHENITTMHYT